MQYIPKVMMLLDMGYKIIKLKNINHILKTSRKINTMKDRHVCIHNGTVYKVINNGLPDIFWDVLKSGFYKVAAPTLRGIIMHGEDGVGYFMDRCITLHMNPREMDIALNMLKELYLRTGYVFADYHSMNFGQINCGTGVTILDLESVVKQTDTKDLFYNEFIRDWNKNE